MIFTYPFNEHDASAAYDEWGCNCGPSALAFALQIGLDKVRGMIPGFEDKHYTSPTMMKAALGNLKAKWYAFDTADKPHMFHPLIALVRVQWCGPWTAPKANPKWAYRQTHWIATWLVEKQAAQVFDVNGGIRGFQSWEKEIVPLILASYPRANGEWFPTHIWRIES